MEAGLELHATHAIHTFQTSVQFRVCIVYLQSKKNL